jgi:subfamily B ATP-binding cassette protein MsbA
VTAVVARLRALRDLFGAYRPAKALAVGAVLLSGLATAFEGFGILFILPFLQKMIQGGQAALTLPVAPLAPLERWLGALTAGWQMPGIAAVIVTSVVAREALLYTAGLLKFRVALTVENVYRARLHRALVEAEYGVVSAYPHGHFQTMLAIESTRIRALALQIIGLAETAAVAGTVLVLMALISLPLTAAVLGLLLVLGVPLTRFFKWIYRTGSGRINTRIALMNYLADLMPFLRTVHVLAGQAHEHERFRGRYGEVFRQDYALQKVATLVGPTYHTLGTVGILGLAVLALALRGGDAGSLGWVIPFVVLFARFLPILNTLNVTLSTLGDTFAAYDRFVAGTQALGDRRMTEGTGAFPPAFRRLELRGVTFGYDPALPVLRDFSLRLDRGRHVAIVGPSGCGKSTVCLLICRLYDPQAGAVAVDGLDLRALSLASLRGAVTLVEQTPVLLNDTVRANIVYGLADVPEAAVRAAAVRAHADEFIRELPQGYDTSVGNLGTAISGGQRQRIAIARALLRRPQLLILDEATSAVDSQSETLIKATIEALRGETTIVSVAHRLSTIKEADEIHFVAGGRIVGSGTFADLLADHPDFRDYVKAQDLSDAG